MITTRGCFCVATMSALRSVVEVRYSSTAATEASSSVYEPASGLRVRRRRRNVATASSTSTRPSADAASQTSVEKEWSYPAGASKRAWTTPTGIHAITVGGSTRPRRR